VADEHGNQAEQGGAESVAGVSSLYGTSKNYLRGHRCVKNRPDARLKMLIYSS
jgi:hypothetical protein